jgi:hypothetical protein
MGLPGHDHSPALSQRPTICAVTNAIESDLDVLGMGRMMHVLGNSLGARPRAGTRATPAGAVSRGDLTIWPQLAA